MTVTEIINLLHKSVQNRDYDFVPTIKNSNSKREYGLSLFEIEDFLLSITEEDLIKGPIRDKDILNEEVFVFSKEILPGVTFYLKIKKDNKVTYDRIKVLSCHEINYWEVNDER